MPNTLTNLRDIKVAQKALLPFTAAHGLLGTRSAADTPETLAAALSSVANAAVMGCWAVAAVAIGTVLLMRQDS